LPLLVHWAIGTEDLDSAHFDFLDLQLLKPVSSRWNVGALHHTCFRDRVQVRASADGQVFGLWGTHVQPQGMQTFVLNNRQVETCYRHDDCFHLIPSPDGTTVYTAFGTFSNRLQPLDQRRDEGPLLLPAVHGDRYLKIEPPVRFLQPSQGSTASAHRLGGPAEVKVPDLDLNLAGEQKHRDEYPYDKRLFFIPEAHLIITLPHPNDRLILHRFDPEAAGRQ
jgi:hypothetical protein